MDKPACIVSATTASFCSVVKRRRRATPVMISTRENVSDIGMSPRLTPGSSGLLPVSGQNGEQF